jgi:hypothetical protein
MAKRSTQLLVDPPVKQRIEALALVRGQLQSDTLRRMVEHVLPAFEAENVSELEELYELLDGMKVDRGRALEAMLKAKLPVAALRGRKRFPLPLG